MSPTPSHLYCAGLTFVLCLIVRLASQATTNLGLGSIHQYNFNNFYDYFFNDYRPFPLAKHRFKKHDLQFSISTEQKDNNNPTIIKNNNLQDEI